ADDGPLARRAVELKPQGELAALVRLGERARPRVELACTHRLEIDVRISERPAIQGHFPGDRGDFERLAAAAQRPQGEGEKEKATPHRSTSWSEVYVDDLPARNRGEVHEGGHVDVRTDTAHRAIAEDEVDDVGVEAAPAVLAAGGIGARGHAQVVIVEQGAGLAVGAGDAVEVKAVGPEGGSAVGRPPVGAGRALADHQGGGGAVTDAGDALRGKLRVVDRLADHVQD